MGIYVGSYSNSPASSSLVFMMPPPIRSCSKCADPLRRVAAISFPFSLCQRHSLLCRRECFGKYFGILLFFSKCVYLAFNWQILQHLNCTFPGHSSWNDGSDSYHLYWLGPQIPPTSTPYPILPLGTPADFDTGWMTKHRRKYILKRQQWLILSILTLSSDPPHVYPDIWIYPILPHPTNPLDTPADTLTLAGGHSKDRSCPSAYYTRNCKH